MTKQHVTAYLILGLNYRAQIMHLIVSIQAQTILVLKLPFREGERRSGGCTQRHELSRPQIIDPPILRSKPSTLLFTGLIHSSFCQIVNCHYEEISEGSFKIKYEKSARQKGK